MKVLQINSVCGYGSTGRIAADLSKVIFKSGGDCTIAYGRGSAPDGIKTIKIGGNFDVNFHAFMSRLTDKTGFYSKNATKEFIKRAAEYDPDVIHLHNIHGYYINIELLFDYIRNANKPVIWTLHDCWPYTGHCAYYTSSGCGRWEKGCYDCPQKDAYPKSFVDNSKANYTNKKKIFTSFKKITFVTPSKWLKSELSESFLKDYKSVVIENGIDMDIFKPTDAGFREKHSLSGKKILLGVASVWEKRKGFDDFLELSKLIDNDTVIVLVGVNAEQKSRLNQNMIGVERTADAAELAGIYSTADYFLNPTYEDNFPTTNLEAMACGTPVITYNTGGSPEAIAEGCGSVVPTGDIKAMYEKTFETYRREDILKNAANFDKNICFKKYIELYEKAVGND